MGAFRRGRKKRRGRPNRSNGSTLGESLKFKLASVTLSSVKKIFGIASFLKTIPVEVDSAKGLRVRPFSSWWQRWLFWIPHAVVYSYSVFQAVSFYHVCSTQGLSTESALHIAYIVFYMLGLLYYLTILGGRVVFVDAINAIDFLIRWSEDWSNTKWNQTIVGLFAINYFAFLTLGTLTPIITAMYILMPNHSRYLYSVLPEDLKNGLTFAVGGVLETVVYVWIASLVCVFNSYVWMMVLQTFIWLDDLCRLAEATGGNAEDWRLLIRFYRSLQCLNILYNDFLRHLTSGFNVTLVSITVLLVYCTIRAYNLLPLALYIIFPSCALFSVVLIMTLYPYVALWESKSMDFISICLARLRPLRHREEDFDILYKEARAFWPICKEISHFGVASLETSKTVNEHIIDNLLLLLSL